MKIVKLIGALPLFAARVAMVLLLVLIAVMTYEVFCRYVLGAPTIWSFDIAFMTNGALFILAAGYALRRDAHIRIDFLATMMPLRVQHGVNLAFFLLILLPAMTTLAYIAVNHAFNAYLTGRRELTSAWGPQVWPYYSTLAFGLVVLCLQIVVDAIRYCQGLRDPSAVTAPGVSDSHELI